MSLTLKSLSAELVKNKVSPLYCIMGPEVFLINESLRLLKAQVLSPSALDFNYEVFRADEVAMERVREAVETLPVLSDKRIVVCESAHRLKEADWKALEPVVKTPTNTCVLVFVSVEPDKRKKVIKEILSSCTAISAESPRDADWSKWIKWMGTKEGISFSEPALSLIKEYACSDLMNLSTEVKKLKSLSGGKQHISEEDVLKAVPRVRQENIFALSTAIGQKNLSQALMCLVRLLEDNQNEVGALALISRHIRILARVKEGLKKGHTEQTLCGKTGVHKFFIREYIQSAELWTEKKLLATLEILKATDRALKSSPVSAHIWLENFIIKTCST